MQHDALRRGELRIEMGKQWSVWQRGVACRAWHVLQLCM